LIVKSFVVLTIYIKMDLTDMGMGWIYLAQDIDQWRVLANTAKTLRTPLNFGKFLSNCITGGFLRRVQLHGVS
jgi:hypothetical protein